MRLHSLFLILAAPLCAAVLLVVAGGAWAATACRSAIEHPIDARVIPLDPVRRGSVVRFEVVADSRVDLKKTWARVLPEGGVRVVGSAHAEMAARAGRARERSAIFRVIVPPAAHRQLVQFRIEGEGPNGLLTRGVAFNLMPDGPSETLRVARAGNGDAVLETTVERSGR